MEFIETIRTMTDAQLIACFICFCIGFAIG